MCVCVGVHPLRADTEGLHQRGLSLLEDCGGGGGRGGGRRGDLSAGGDGQRHGAGLLLDTLDAAHTSALRCTYVIYFRTTWMVCKHEIVKMCPCVKSSLYCSFVSVCVCLTGPCFRLFLGRETTLSRGGLGPAAPGQGTERVTHH